MRIPRILQHLSLSAALATALAALPFGAQEVPAVGARLPRFELDGLAQTEARGCDELYGRTLLLSFFAFWSPACAEPVPFLNDLHERYSGQGLTVLGVTREELRKSAPWVERHGLRSAWGKDPGGALSDLFQVPTLPYFVLVDAFGEVRWVGHARRLGDIDFQRALEGSLETPVWRWPEEARALVPLLVQGRYGAALAAARELPATDGADALSLLGGLIRVRLETLEKRIARGHGYRAYRLCLQLVEELSGTKDAERVNARLLELQQDPEVQKQLALVEALIECELRIRNLAQARSQRAGLERILSQKPGPEIAARARRRLVIVLDVVLRIEKNNARKGERPR